MSIEGLIFVSIIIGFLIILNGFFATAEIAIVSSRRSVLEKLAREGSERARAVLQMKDEPERFLATIQVGITVIGTLASVTGGVASVGFLKPLFEAIPVPVVREISELLSVGVITVILSYAILVAGELAPKSIALRHAERIACFSSRPLEIFSRATRPFERVLTVSTTSVLKLLGIKEKREDVFAPRDEIKYYIKEGIAKGGIEKTEAELLRGVFEFADTEVKKIMVPKPKFVALDVNIPAAEALELITKSGFSRYPVYENNLNQIVGVLFNKDVFKPLEEGRPFVLRELVRPPYFVPDSVMISKLLREMQRRHVHMAIVLDEHGDVDGLVTIEDILEEIVGEIEDEYDVEKGGLVERLRDGSLIIDASASLSDLVEAGLPFDDADIDRYTTLAGFLLAKLQRIPGGGEFVLYKNHRFTVVNMEKHRIARVKAETVGKPSVTSPGPSAVPSTVAR